MMRSLALAVLLVAALPARADEGMWTYNGFPKDRLAKQYGVKVDDAWLERVRLSSVRLAQGCSSSFVSPNGLVLTNHHCVESCLQDISSSKKDFLADGFLARSRGEEVKCPVLEANQLTAITDVTARVKKATAGLAGKAFQDAQNAEIGRIESECQTSPALRCNVVTLYRGGRYDLYRYQRYQDVRMVFAPEFAIAFFGGDPDNFMFPRYDLDMAIVRVYQDGKPLANANWLPWDPAGSKEGDVVFVSGHPGGTDRQLAMSELEYQRDVQLPNAVARLSELRGALTEFQNRGTEQKRVSSSMLFGVENSLKVLKGERTALVDREFWAQKAAAEAAFRKALAADPKNGPAALKAYADLAVAVDLQRNVRDELGYVQASSGFMTTYFAFARTLVRGGDERKKPSTERLPEFQDAKLPAVTQSLFSSAPIDDEFEIFKLTWSLTKLREVLGADHPFTRKVLGQESPGEMATRLVKGTKLRDVALRKSLWEGGKAAVDASQDPMIVLARLVDPDSRAVRKMYEDEIDSVVKRSHEAIAAARFAVEGTSSYPDATFTLRLSYGTVKGWTEGKKVIPAFTTLGGAFERATGRDPFRLPQSWLDAKSKLDLSTHFDLSATTDIIGGNSGSPVVNKDGRLVGLVFDGNIWSLGGNYGFDEKLNRTVAVDSSGMTEALRKIYKADELLKELVPAGK